MHLPIIDFHCDLLSYLEENPTRTPYAREVHCAVPQLKEGQVKLQVLAVFTRTKMDALRKGALQIEIFKQLPHRYPKDFAYFHENFMQADQIHLCLAIENASGLCDEDEPLEKGLKRLRALYQSVAKPVYIGMTWNMENRFGGGNVTKIGLKIDGRHLLEEMHEKKIAIDLSHASDALAYDILDYIENKNLIIPILASHSNARGVLDHPRNLPDPLAKEIMRKQGLIGLNFYTAFVGESGEDFVKHIEYWLERGAEKNICLGADFFYEGDSPALVQEKKKPYFDQFQDAASYPRLLELLQKRLGLSDTMLRGLAYQNAQHFLKQNE